MNYNQHCAAKDYLRAAYCTIDDLIYASSRFEVTDSISMNFISQMQPLCRAAISFSDDLLLYSSSEPVKGIAKNITEMSERCIKDLRMARRYCSHRATPKDEYNDYMSNADRIMRRLFEELRGKEISERLNCDYLRHMICLIEGVIRMSENALCFELCSALAPTVREMAADGRRTVTAMQKMLLMFDM